MLRLMNKCRYAGESQPTPEGALTACVDEIEGPAPNETGKGLRLEVGGTRREETAKTPSSLGEKSPSDR